MIRTMCGGRWLLLGLALGLGAGCSGPKNVMVEGRLLQNGKPYQRAAKEMFNMTFYPVAEGDKAANRSYPADVDTDGTFKVPGLEGKGIPPGKYQIAVTSMVIPESRPGSSAPPPGDRFNDAFAYPNSPIVREVGQGPVEKLDIDLSKAKGP